MIEVLKVVYGGQVIEEEGVRDDIARAIKRYEDYDVTRENFGLGPLSQPSPTVQASIQWRLYDHGPVIQQTIDAGDVFDFSRYVKKIVYGGALINNPTVYDLINTALRTKDIWYEGQKKNPLLPFETVRQVVLNNDFFNMDPQPGRQKVVDMYLISDDSRKEKWVRAYEGDRWPSQEKMKVSTTAS